MKMKRLKMVIWGVLAVALCVALTGCGKKTFNVTETIEVDFEGYNGYGICTLENEYDWIDNVMDWYGDKITNIQRDFSTDELMYTVTYRISKEKNLYNGDTVTVTPVIGSAAEDYAFNLTGEDITVTVEGLEEVEEFDPFDNVTVSFEGISPNGKAVIKSKNNDSISYEADKESGLSNGDKITVTAVPFSDMNEYAREYGKVFSATEKTFTVEGLSAYAMKVDEIPDDMKEKMLKQADDSIQASCASWHEGNSLKESKFIGYYMLTSKEGFSQNPYNEIYCVYKITASVKGLKRGGDGKTEEKGEETYYTYYHYSNIMLLPDGNCSLDLSKGKMADNRIESDYGQESIWGANFYSYKGYKDLDSMFNACVTQKIGTYNYESTVK